MWLIETIFFLILSIIFKIWKQHFSITSRANPILKHLFAIIIIYNVLHAFLFAEDMAEAVVQACAKCTDAQKHIFKRFLEVIKEKDPRGYRKFQQKYDPQNKYLAALEAAIANA